MKKYPILILHGWNLSGKKFQPLIESFQSKGYSVFAPDLPGFGENSSISKSLVLDDYVVFVADFFKKNLCNEIILIGHSFGGRVSIKFAAKYPQKIKLLILTGVPGFVPVSQIKIFIFLILSKVGNIFFLIPPFYFIKRLARKFLYKMAGANDYLHTEGVMKETFKSIIREDLIQYMKMVKTLTLLVWGELDKTVSVSIAQKMEKAIKKSRLIIVPNTGHNLPYVHQEKFIEAIREYL